MLHQLPDLFAGGGIGIEAVYQRVEIADMAELKLIIRAADRAQAPAGKLDDFDVADRQVSPDKLDPHLGDFAREAAMPAGVAVNLLVVENPQRPALVFQPRPDQPGNWNGAVRPQDQNAPVVIHELIDSLLREISPRGVEHVVILKHRG